jgi:hypothetical protein
MNIEIRNGNLWIERNGVMREQICPFATVEMDIFPVCGEWCPQFTVIPGWQSLHLPRQNNSRKN